MAIALMVAMFIVGYFFIAMEHKFKVDKSAIALLLSVTLWVIYIFAAELIIPGSNSLNFQNFLLSRPDLASQSFAEQCIRFVVDHQIVEHLGETAEVLLFLIGAMTIVDLIDLHGGFNFITDRITTRDKQKLLWVLSCITFCMSAILDNMTSTIVMIMLLRKLVSNYKERWIFASMIVIAANSGGAFSPIGDVTTIMLWVKGNVSSIPLIKSLIVPCIFSLLVPLLFATRLLKGVLSAPGYSTNDELIPKCVTRTESRKIFFLGVLVLIMVPVFKSITNLPPYMGILAGLGIMWVYTEILYDKKRNMEESIKQRVAKVIKHIDMPTILFFLGILMSVAALQSAGILTQLSSFLDEKIHNIYVINVVIGFLSSVVDNVPLVAAAIGMYPVVDPTTLSTIADAGYFQFFVQDGQFWHLLAYCAGVGGSVLIIGSAAGVVAMGLEKINFMWYVKNISLMAALGYLAGVGIYMLQVVIGFV